MKVFTANKFLLYIRPQNTPSLRPVIDYYTLKLGINMVNGGVLEHTTIKGIHLCNGCKIHSTSHDILLPNGFITNKLALHYLMYHRSEVPSEELSKIYNMERI